MPLKMEVMRLLAAVCVALVSFTKGFEMNDLVTELPGQPKVEFRQFAGYVPVGTANKSSLFYYFVEAETDAINRPLTVWLTGGPGCAASGEAFEGGMGPFFPTLNARKLEKNSYAWNKVSNILFVDSPVGAGWSSSSDPNDYYHGDRNTTDDLVSFMLSWYEKYPSFKSRALYVAGSSYGAHFGSNLANALLNYNKESKCFKFNLKGVALGNPLLRWKLESIMAVELLLTRGMIKQEDYRRMLKACNYTENMEYSAMTNSTSCSEVRTNVSNAAFQHTALSSFDILREACDNAKAATDLKQGKEVSLVKFGLDSCMHPKIEFYMNQPEVLKAFHADRNQYTDKNFQGCFREKLHYNKGDRATDMLPTLKQILEQGINITVFSGDQDGVIPANATRKNLDVLAKDLKLPATKVDQAYLVDNKIVGWEVIYGDKLAYRIIKGANHHVTSSAPAAALQILSNLLSGNV